MPEMEPTTSLARTLLRDHFAIGPWTDPRSRVGDNLTAPQFVAMLVLIEAEARQQERERIANDLIFDLPIGDDINYSRGYSAAIREMRRVLREEPT